jgi:UDP-N-acetyl-2-amino-2-deoxyglucuronate dehydrogenase
LGKSKLRLGIVGCGEIAGYTALVSRLIPQVRLTACCDAVPGRAQAFAQRHHIPTVYPDFAGLLSSADLEAVYLAVPHHLHATLVLKAAQAGCAVLVEKPLTRNFEEGARLVTALEGAKVGVNYQYRYDTGCHALARAIQAGALGWVNSVRINVPWHRQKSYFEQSPWHKYLAQAGGGTLLTQGSHFLDVVLWALNDPPVSACGYCASPGFDVEVDTLVHGVVATQGGTLVSITSSMVAAREGAVTIECYGENGTAVYSDRPFPHVSFSGLKVHKQLPPVWGVFALQRSLAGFTRWVLMDKPYLTPAAQALPVLATVDALYRSSCTGLREPINKETHHAAKS